MVARAVRSSSPLRKVIRASHGPAGMASSRAIVTVSRASDRQRGAERGRERPGAESAGAGQELQCSAHVDRAATDVVHGREDDRLALGGALRGERVDREVGRRRPARPHGKIDADPDAADLEDAAVGDGLRAHLGPHDAVLLARGRVVGTLIVTVDVTRPPAGMSEATGSTDVHRDTSFGVCPAAPRKEPFSIVAAEGYKATCIVEPVVFETSIRRWMVVPGARWSTM